MRPVHIHSIATAVPPNVLTQAEAEDIARFCFAPRISDFDRLAGVFRNSGIERRNVVRPAEWYLSPLGWPERMTAFKEGAGELFVRAAERALRDAELSAAEIDAVVTVSSTGIVTPTLEALKMAELGFRQDVRRVPVFGLGCAGGATGLSLAAHLALAQPGARVLLVVVELCSLSFRMDQLTKANLVATALFADGAAACVVSTRAVGQLAIVDHAEHTWRDTLGIMGWTVDAEGLGVIFDKDIPSFAEAKLHAALAAAVAPWGDTPGRFDGYVCHPGGAKVIAALETAMALDTGRLQIERQILAEHGNMSAPTVLFVLERAIRGKMTGRTLLMAMGPGFTLSCVKLLAEYDLGCGHSAAGDVATPRRAGLFGAQYAASD